MKLKHADEWRKAEKAAKAYLKGSRYTERQKAEILKSGRPPLKINMLLPLVNYLRGFGRKKNLITGTSARKRA